ncbi:MAG: hypothetical protein EXR59_01310 [Dehalococcoidia bacterium]|nr:hypothetical protein [Dehalococcoidia bacterium]
MKVRFVEITTGEELLLSKCNHCNTGFAVAAMSKSYSGMIEAKCFDCDSTLDFYTSRQGTDRKIWVLDRVETEKGPIASTAVAAAPVAQSSNAGGVNLRDLR